VIQPFVYRRDVDPGVATSLAELVQRSRAELSPAPERDLKLGPGGIREAEFFVQALQLIWGGREPGLRTQGTLKALERLRAFGYVTDREAQPLADAYLLLRRVEHAVQWRTGIQTHLLPLGMAEVATLARTLGFGDARRLEGAVSAARETVHALFRSILQDAPRPPSPHTALLARLVDPDSEVVELESDDVLGDPEVMDHLAALARRPDALLGALTQERHPGLADEVLDAIAGCSDPEQAARYLRELFGRFTSLTPYLQLLAAHPNRVGRLVAVLGSSAFVGDALVARPDLADIVLFERTLPDPAASREAVREEVDGFYRQRSDPAPEHEQREELIGALRRAQSKVMVQIAVADLAGELGMREVTMALSDLADETLEQALRWELEGDPRGLSVIAVGKLGGREIGYGSDLDVLFIYDPLAAPPGEHPGEYFRRRAQHIVRLLTTPHQVGTGYELDTRLRPSGSQGLLVTSLAAFARYHRVPLDGTPPPEGSAVLSSGATWERQALLRARACAGDRALGDRVIRVAHVAAYEQGAAPAEEVHHLRRRMERELARERPGRYDIKTGRGGLLDVEFATQWLQMRHGRDPGVRTADTLEALDALYERGYLGSAAHQTLRAGYRFLRRLEQRIRILNATGATRLDASSPGLSKLARRMGFERGPSATEASALLASYRDVTTRIREAYLGVLGVPE
jgi:[glutamine synthetase] adenylyltransferase / [glutamine synthetase]-adenylyl-L-tyrosine phosphorylase